MKILHIALDLLLHQMASDRYHKQGHRTVHSIFRLRPPRTLCKHDIKSSTIFTLKPVSEIQVAAESLSSSAVWYYGNDTDTLKPCLKTTAQTQMLASHPECNMKIWRQQHNKTTHEMQILLFQSISMTHCKTNSKILLMQSNLDLDRLDAAKLQYVSLSLSWCLENHFMSTVLKQQLWEYFKRTCG